MAPFLPYLYHSVSINFVLSWKKKYYIDPSSGIFLLPGSREGEKNLCIFPKEGSIRSSRWNGEEAPSVLNQMKNLFMDINRVDFSLSFHLHWIIMSCYSAWSEFVDCLVFNFGLFILLNERLLYFCDLIFYTIDYLYCEGLDICLGIFFLKVDLICLVLCESGLIEFYYLFLFLLRLFPKIKRGATINTIFMKSAEIFWH